MSFRKNTSQQITFEDSLYGLTARERKALNGSWAKYFADEIFPYIDEEPFRVLYSEKDSRPNTPVNVCVAALIIKELMGASDEEMVENLALSAGHAHDKLCRAASERQDAAAVSEPLRQVSGGNRHRSDS